MLSCYHMRRQMNLRLPPVLVDQLQDEAARRGESANTFAERALRAAVDPSLAGSEANQLRARLRQAGLLEELPPYEGPIPERAVLERARVQASRGKPPSEIISEDRG